MTQNEQDGRAIEHAKETPGHSPDCPNCGEQGFGSPPKYRENLFKCTNGDCAVWMFHTYRGEDSGE